MLYLLQIVLPSVSDNVKRLKCNDCLDIFLNTYKSHQNDIEPSAVRSLVACIGEILIAQETSPELWESSIVKKSFSLLLSSCMHDSGKVRRFAQEVLLQIMEAHSKNGFSITSRQVIRQLDILCKEFNEDDYHDVINYLMFISKVVLFLNHSFYPTLFQLLLKVFFYTLSYF